VSQTRIFAAVLLLGLGGLGELVGQTAPPDDAPPPAPVQSSGAAKPDDAPPAPTPPKSEPAPFPVATPVLTPKVIEAPSSTSSQKPPAFRLLEPDPPPVSPSIKVEPLKKPVLVEPKAPARFNGPQTPSLTLDKIIPASAEVGKPLVYEIVVRNVGVVSATQVRVEDELPAGTRLVTATPMPATENDRLIWKLEKLDPDKESRFKVEVEPSSAGEFVATAAVIVSLAQTAHTSVKGLPVPTPIAPVSAAKVTGPSMLALTLKGPERALVGQAVTFQLWFTNTGSAPLDGLILNVHLPPGLHHPQGNEIETDDFQRLAPGESKKIDLPTTAVQAGRWVMGARITAKNGQQASAEAVVQVSPTPPPLTIRQLGPQKLLLGQEARYRLEIVNPLKTAVHRVRVTDVLPEGLEFRGAEGGGTYTPSLRTVAWVLDTVGPGQKREVSLKVRAKELGSQVKRTVAQADRGSDARLETILQIDGTPSLLVALSPLDHPIEVGKETTYAIEVSNRGNGACTGLKIVALLPEGLAPRGAEGPTPYHIQGQQVVFEPFELLAAQTHTVYRVHVAGRTPGDWRFRIQMTCDQLQLPVYREEDASVYRMG
jgi:uncharacterized repeat protein (TIGR01451 family)